MHIVYASAVFLFVGLGETLRHGIFGLTAAEIAAISTGTLVLFAVLILRGDLIHLLRPPRPALYGSPRLVWSWGRSALILPLGLLVVAAPGAATAVLGAPPPLSTETLLELTVLQIALTTLPEELFFREAALKSFHQSIPAIYLISVLAWFIYHMPSGLPVAVTSAGAGAVYLTLRLIGINILTVAALHGAVNVMLPRLAPPDVTGAASWLHVGYFIAASAAVCAVLLHSFARPQKQGIFSHA